MQRRTITTNTIIQNEATYDFGPVRTMTSAAHRSRIFCVRPESHRIGMVPNILGIHYSSNGSLIVVLANGTSIYYVSIVSRNPFSFWIPQGMIPNFSLSLPRILWNYTPRFAEVNHAFDRMTLPLRLTNFPMGLLALPDQTENVNTGLSREVIFARMNRIMYQSTGRSISDDNDTCSICLDDYSDGQVIGSADCQHTFHFDCISQWLMQKNSCPLCKRIALAI
ncbi:hypothetical protein KY284_011060 [Solanum tuberosum]|nr:hypothetical protein KY284_011060 [Solanum tuberosum]